MTETMTETETVDRRPPEGSDRAEWAKAVLEAAAPTMGGTYIGREPWNPGGWARMAQAWVKLANTLAYLAPAEGVEFPLTRLQLARVLYGRPDRKKPTGALSTELTRKLNLLVSEGWLTRTQTPGATTRYTLARPVAGQTAGQEVS